MSISKSVGRCTLFALVVYRVVKGAPIVVPRNMVAAVSALVAALVHACCGRDEPASVQQQSVVVPAVAPIHYSESAVASVASRSASTTKEP